MSNKASPAAFRLYNCFFMIDIVILLYSVNKYDDDDDDDDDARQLARCGLSQLLLIIANNYLLHIRFLPVSFLQSDRYRI